VVWLSWDYFIVVCIVSVRMSLLVIRLIMSWLWGLDVSVFRVCLLFMSSSC